MFIDKEPVFNDYEYNIIVLGEVSTYKRKDYRKTGWGLYISINEANSY